MKTGLVLLRIHTTKVCQAIFYYLMNTYNILFVHLAIKSLSTGEATAIVLCCSAFLVGIMITLIILLTVGFISKKKQLQAVQTPNSAHIIQDDRIATSNANLRQETQPMFHYTQNDEVNLNANGTIYRVVMLYTNCRSLAILSVQQITTVSSSSM